MCRAWRFSLQRGLGMFSLSRAPRSGRDTLGLARAKRHRGPRLKDDIRASPWLCIGQPPAMSAADRILSEKDVARMDEEVLAFARLEIQRSAQRNDQLPDWSG